MAKARLTKTARRLHNFWMRMGNGAVAGSVEQDAMAGKPLTYWQYLRDEWKAAWRVAGWLERSPLDHPLRGRSPRGNKYPCGSACWALVQEDIALRKAD